MPPGGRGSSAAMSATSQHRRRAMEAPKSRSCSKAAASSAAIGPPFAVRSALAESGKLWKRPGSMCQMYRLVSTSRNTNEQTCVDMPLARNHLLARSSGGKLAVCGSPAPSNCPQSCRSAANTNSSPNPCSLASSAARSPRVRGETRPRLRGAVGSRASWLFPGADCSSPRICFTFRSIGVWATVWKRRGSWGIFCPNKASRLCHPAR
mmetsp:Transcript_2474/g.7464  ORF Transcript_2474/g.7464 Transcript_2474/m.7464 type:complete len:208 (-) Transcript_2474:118-741(-)